MVDLVHLFSKLVDQKGKILVPGVNELVDPLTAEEDALYEPIDFDPEEFRQDIGADRLLHTGEDSKKKILQHRWRYPSLSIHGKYFYLIARKFCKIECRENINHLIFQPQKYFDI